jgi:hypothetical protein
MTSETKGEYVHLVLVWGGCRVANVPKNVECVVAYYRIKPKNKKCPANNHEEWLWGKNE